MTTNLSKAAPAYIHQDENAVGLNRNYRRSILYYRKMDLAWPEWCAEHPEFKVIYNVAKKLRSKGFKVHVDHIVPICSDIVCGLHVPWNLQIIDELQNLRKSNMWWPDHPFENLELF